LRFHLAVGLDVEVVIALKGMYFISREFGSEPFNQLELVYNLAALVGYLFLGSEGGS